MFRVVILVAFAAALSTGEDKGWQICAETLPPYGEAFFDFSPQGVADDLTGNNFIFTGKHVLRLVTVSTNSTDVCRPSATVSGGAVPSYTFTTTKVHHDAIPNEWKSIGYDHIGDADWEPEQNNLIIPLEEPTFTHPALLMFDPKTLTYKGKGQVTKQSHMPWAAHVPDNSWVVSSEFDNVTFLYVYDYPTLKPLGRLYLDIVGDYGVMNVQGGVVRKCPKCGHKILHFSTNQKKNPNGTNIFVFDLSVAALNNKTARAKLKESQKVEWTDGIAESEGLTIVPKGSSLSPKPTMWVVTNLWQLLGKVFTLTKEES